MRVFVDGVGVRGPGLNGWQASREVLAGKATYTPAPLVVPPSELLPPAERRRTVPTVKLALAVGSEAVTHAGCDAALLATVFSSSCGDGETVHQIFEVLASTEREVSPTRFHNSVHNASAGYWSIATQSREPSTSLCCYDASFSAGLIEAAVQATVGTRAVGLIVYDLPYPEPLHGVRPIGAGFGMALVLSPQIAAHSLAQLDIQLLRDGVPSTCMSGAALEDLRAGNPAARSLPLLAALAREVAEEVTLEYIAGNRLVVQIVPC
jgi:hypothetical protein